MSVNGRFWVVSVLQGRRWIYLKAFNMTAQDAVNGIVDTERSTYGRC
mgnify:CR=1 FL=1